MASTRVGNAIIGQSGGPTHVINQSLVGCVTELQKYSQVRKILGAQHGVRGIVGEQFVDLTETPQEKLARVAVTPSAALGSTRDKPDSAYCHRIFEAFRRNDVHYFFYIGGNDSSDTCRIVNQEAKDAGYELHAFHIPKTIDNDLVCNDHTPGYGSAARFVACAFMGDNLDNLALRGIKINVVMGRHAGWLTAASILGRQSDTDGPHLVYVPELAFDTDRFLHDVTEVYQRLGRCVVAVSEGIHDESGKPIAEVLALKRDKDVERDPHGNVQLSGSGALGDFLAELVREGLSSKPRVRADTFGYLQRCCADMASPVDQREAFEVGVAAARFSMEGDVDGSVSIVRTSNDPYRVKYERIALDAVAAKTRKLPPEFLEGTNNIAPEFRSYALPLVGELPIVEVL